jgi:hypothetical protein
MAVTTFLSAHTLPPRVRRRGHGFDFIAWGEGELGLSSSEISVDFWGDFVVAPRAPCLLPEKARGEDEAA